MKTYTVAAIVLIAIGIVAFAYQGISYTSSEKVIDIGPIQVSADKTRTCRCRRSSERLRWWAASLCW